MCYLDWEIHFKYNLFVSKGFRENDRLYFCIFVTLPTDSQIDRGFLQIRRQGGVKFECCVYKH